MFSIRRPSARNRLQDLAKQLKQLSAKLKRHHKVMYARWSLDAAKKRKVPKVERAVRTPDGKRVGVDAAGSGDTPGSKRIKVEVANAQNKTSTGDNANSTTAQVNIPLFAMDRTARPNAALGITSSGTPILKEKDKFVHHHRFGSNLHCPDFNITSKYPLGAISTSNAFPSTLCSFVRWCRMGASGIRGMI